MDFRRGFYTTTIREQAEAWAKLNGEVIEFRIPKEEYNKLNQKLFIFSKEELEEFVLQNRKGIYQGKIYDVVLGPYLANPPAFIKGKEPPKWKGQQSCFLTQKGIDLLNEYMVR